MSLLLVGLLLSAQAPAPAAAPPQSNLTVAPPKPKKEKKICKVDDADTGTHMVKRTCLTQEQWDARVQGRSVDEFNSTMPNGH